MGYRNVARVYNGWGGALPGEALATLAYMALHSRDEDQDPWYGLGHEDLAVHRFGLKMLDEGDKKRDNQMRHVRRHITTLLDKRAIETKKRATYGLLGTRHVVYRLYLDGPGISSAFEALRNAAGRGYRDAPSPESPE
jgi:hypothetical protein